MLILPLVVLSTPVSAQGATTEELRSAPHTLHARYETRARFDDPEQGIAVWDVRMTGDGSLAWTVASVANPHPTFVPEIARREARPDGKMEVWFVTQEAIRYDLAKGERTVCQASSVFHAGPGGVVDPHLGNLLHMTAKVSTDVLRNWVWGLLGDATVSSRLPYAPTQQPSGDALPLAQEGSAQIESDWVMKATLVSFEPNIDTSVRLAAERVLERCSNTPVRSHPNGL